MLLQGNFSLEFKECGTLLGRRFGEFEILRICFGAKDMEMAWESNENETLLGRRFWEV